MFGSRKTSWSSGAFASILPARQRRWHTASFVVLTLLCADTLFLLAHRGLGQVDGWVGWGRVASRFYQAMVLLHSALGYVLTLMLLGFVVFHVPVVVRQLRRRWLLALSGAVVAGSFGFLLYSGNYFLLHSKSTGNEWLYWGHMGLAGLFLMVYAGHRLLATRRFPARPVAALLAAGFAVALIMIGGEVTERTVRIQKAAVKPPLPPFADATGFAPVSGINPAAPFFPSPVAMASGAARINTTALTGTFDAAMAAQVREEVARKGFASTRRIGAEDCARCHADTVAQWESSAHRFSSFNNPFYASSLEELRASNGVPNDPVVKHLETFGYTNVRTGQIKSQFCAACHDPALLFEGRMREEIDPGEIRAQAGLACLACHQIKDVPGHTGNANYVWDDEFKDPYLFSASSGPIATLIHDLYLKANPEQHKRDMLKPSFSTAEFCGTCHKVAIETPVNEYHFVRGQDEYDAWNNSGVPLNAARTFYQPKEASTCQTCHMPLEPAVLGDVAAKNGKVKSHRFVAVNTALPFVRGDSDMIERTEAFLRDKKLRVSFAGLRAGAQIGLTTEDPQASLSVSPGESPEINIVVRNLGVGHTFPGGTNDSNQGWIEITLEDEAGHTLLRAGGVDEHGKVVENTRIYNAVFIDRFSNRVAKRNAQAIAALVYVAVIPPSSSDVVRFRVPVEAIPPETRKVKITARLLWRKFNRDFSEFVRATQPKAFEGLSSDLPITEIAKATAEMSIDRNATGCTFTLRPYNDVPVAQRYTVTHDYGVALLLQGDTVIGRSVMEGLVARAPDCATCLRTLARLYLADRDYPAARKTLLEHEKRWPGDAQAAWVWAGVLRGEGADDEAVKALDRVIDVYPQDRDAWRLMTEISYRSGHFQKATDAAEHLLSLDPEDATAHYYAMLARRSLGDIVGSKREESAYRWYQRDESAQQMTLDFRKRDAASNYASQPIRVYNLQ
jgi:tetratricopeptide (TPR) repeat protein/cytochrome c553